MTTTVVFQAALRFVKGLERAIGATKGKTVKMDSP